MTGLTRAVTNNNTQLEESRDIYHDDVLYSVPSVYTLHDLLAEFDDGKIYRLPIQNLIDIQMGRPASILTLAESHAAVPNRTCCKAPLGF
jgi:hypothetical protein